MDQETRGTGTEKDNISGSDFLRVFLIWTVASVVLGGLGAYLGNIWFGAPHYFGFFMMFALTGLGGMFALAVLVDKQQNEGR